jgi:excisionase family DNA binding protein
MESRESDSSTSLRRRAMNADTISVDQGTRTTAVVAGHDCLNANELAAYLRVNRKTVYAYAGSGAIPCARLGRRLVFSRAAIAAWLARQAVPASTETVP